MMLKGILRLVSVAAIAGIASAVVSRLASAESGGLANGIISVAVGSLVVGLFLLFDNDSATAAKLAGKCSVAGLVAVTAGSFVPLDISLGAIGAGAVLGVGSVYLWPGGNKPENISDSDERG